MKPYYSDTLPTEEVLEEVAREFPQLERHIERTLLTSQANKEEADDLEKELQILQSRVDELECQLEKYIDEFGVLSEC